MASNDQVSQDKLRSALWLHIGKIVDEETIKLGVNATPQFIGSLTQIVWAQIGTASLFILRLTRSMLCYGLLTCLCLVGTAATDLESFAKHAGRSTIKADDVMLLARRNDGLEQILKEAVGRLQKERLKQKG